MKRIRVVGFYGAYNIGDEAFLRVLFEELKDLCEVSACVNLPYPDYMKYVEEIDPGLRSCGIYDHGEMDMLILGGGALGYTWGVRQMFFAGDSPVVGLGLGFLSTDKLHSKFIPIAKTYLERFDYLSVRNSQSHELLKEKFGVDSIKSSDLALLLKPKHVEHTCGGMEIVVPPYGQREELDTYLRGREEGIIQVPFSKDSQSVVNPEYPSFVSSDPGEILGFMQGARRVTVWGKLHPLVFGAMCGSELSDLSPIEKTSGWLDEVGRFGLDELRSRVERDIHVVKQLLS